MDCSVVTKEHSTNPAEELGRKVIPDFKPRVCE